MSPAARTDIRERVAGSASATGRRASADAVERAIAELGREPGLVLVFPAGDADLDAVAAQAQEAGRGASVAGMTGTAAIGTQGLVDTGCSAIAFSASLDAGLGTSQSGDPRTAGQEATAKAMAAIADSPYAIVLLLVDSEAGDQADIVAGAYAVAGPTIPLAGGAAGGARRAWFADGRALSNGVVAVAIGSSTPIGVGIAHGCIPRAAPSIVTRSDGPKVIQLDGRRALDVYLEKLGVDGELGDGEFEALAMVHPLAEPQLSGDVRPRYVRARTPDGALVCATGIERNAAVEICDQTPETIVQSARAVVEDAVSQLGRPAEAALVFDCAARSAWFGNALAEQELAALAAAFGKPAPRLAGVFTRGEIGRVRGAKGDRNHSVVVVAFGALD